METMTKMMLVVVRKARKKLKKTKKAKKERARKEVAMAIKKPKSLKLVQLRL